MINYLKRNVSLTIGLGLLIFLILFTVHGLLTIEFKQAYPLAVRPKQPPSLKYLFGTDFFGRDLYTAMVVGVWQTAIIGLVAGAAAPSLHVRGIRGGKRARRWEYTPVSACPSTCMRVHVDESMPGSCNTQCAACADVEECVHVQSCTQKYNLHACIQVHACMQMQCLTVLRVTYHYLWSQHASRCLSCYLPVRLPACRCLKCSLLWVWSSLSSDSLASSISSCYQSSLCLC